MSFATTRISAAPPERAPDGSEVRPLARLSGGSFAQFALPAGEASHAVAHRTVEEIWLVLDGRGELWRRLGAREEFVALEAGVCATLPAGTHFQFRALAGGPLTVAAVTMPAWPGDGEAERVAGPWRSRLDARG